MATNNPFFIKLHVDFALLSNSNIHFNWKFKFHLNLIFYFTVHVNLNLLAYKVVFKIQSKLYLN